MPNGIPAARTSLLPLRLGAIAAVALSLLAAACAAPTEGAGEEVATDEGQGALVTGSLAVGTVVRATSELNVRSSASTSGSIVDVLATGETATVVQSAPQGGFYKVKTQSNATGWASGKYLTVVSGGSSSGGSSSGGSSSGGSSSGGSTSGSVAALESIASSSACASRSFRNRGRAPAGYIKGVALTYARAVCNPTRSDVVVASRAETGDDGSDALSWYHSNFAAAGMSNASSGRATLRHTYTLLLALGMQESSGKHCEGRDQSASNTSGSTAEAGAWQTSYDSRSASPELPKLFAKYRDSDDGCLRGTFAQGVTCSSAAWASAGTGEGAVFQRREKECPSFAAEYAAVMLRVAGGTSGHYGPLRTKAAEVAPECDAMLASVERAVLDTPAICDDL